MLPRGEYTRRGAFRDSSTCGALPKIVGHCCDEGQQWGLRSAGLPADPDCGPTPDAARKAPVPGRVATVLVHGFWRSAGSLPTQPEEGEDRQPGSRTSGAAGAPSLASSALTQPSGVVLRPPVLPVTGEADEYHGVGSDLVPYGNWGDVGGWGAKRDSNSGPSRTKSLRRTPTARL